MAFEKAQGQNKKEHTKQIDVGFFESVQERSDLGHYMSTSNSMQDKQLWVVQQNGKC